MPPDSSDPNWKKVVCPICFDLGFTDSVIWEHVENKGVESETVACNESGGGTTDNPGEGKLDTAEPTVLANNRLVVVDTMTHTDNERIEKVYMALVDSDTVEPAVNNVFLDDWEPSSEEDFSTFLPRARHIRDMKIPFKYWLEQPCPARRNDQDAPCIVIRQGVHEYLMETRPDYAAKQSMLRDLGYVELGLNSTSFHIGHRAVPMEYEDGTVVQSPATVWPVESFMLDGIPSPWTKPWNRNSGLVLSKMSLTSGDTASGAAFETATRWFEGCVTSHRSCAVGDIPDLPERVVAIGSADDLDSVKLVSGVGKKARYACLSHSWGPETPCTTTANIERHQEMVPWDFLSPIFQDAIVFLRKFSRWHKEHHGEAIRYIWIDSLCVLQDSGDDWKKQVNQMDDIYSNSHITLLGSYAHEEERRLFGKTASSQAPKKMTVKDAVQRTRDLYLRHALTHPKSGANTSVPPIWTRAWALQERLLSPRLLVFKPDELSWQCSGCNQCECGLEQAKADGHLRMRSWKGVSAGLPQPTSRSMLDVGLGEIQSPAKLRAVWRLILELYSGLDLTKPEDILVAIAGLARSFNKRLGGLEYYAGLWYEEQTHNSETPNPQPETMLDLLWRLRYRRDAQRNDVPPATVDVTWNWAHPQAPIIYPFAQDELLRRYVIIIHIGAALNVPKLPEDRAEVAERSWLHDMYTDAPPSGTTLFGRLWPTELTRMTVGLSLGRAEDHEFEYHLGEPVPQRGGPGKPLDVELILVMPPREEGDDGGQATFEKMPPIAFYPDDLRTEVNGPVFCLPMGVFSHQPMKRGLEEKYMFAGLVLEAVGHMANEEGYDPDLSKRETGDLVFRRLGLAYTPYGGWGSSHEEIVTQIPMGTVRMV